MLVFIVLAAGGLGIWLAVRAYLRDRANPPAQQPGAVEGLLFRSGPGRWGTTLWFWLLAAVGVAAMLGSVWVGVGILAFLGGAAMMNHSTWRTAEVVRAIREGKG